MNTVRVALFIAAWVAIWGMWKQHERIGELNTKNAALLVELTEQVKINEDYQERVQSLHKLDTKHIEALANAKSEIDKLRIAAERNPERVYIKASCKKVESATPSGMDDAVTAPTYRLRYPKLLVTQRANCRVRENNTWLTRLY
ncbi:lysis system i-spanin subunit Rz [Providencia huaxiensis]